MSYSVQTAKGELSGILHGTSLGQVQNINGVFNRAARQLLLDIDPSETKRSQLLSTPIFYQVWDYALPVDLKGNKIIDIYPQVNRFSSDKFTQTYNQNFDLNKITSFIDNFTIAQDSGSKTLRLNYTDSSNSILINTISDLTANGTWSASGTASNLQVNTSTSINNAPALQFDLATGAGYITNSTMNSIDLSNQANLSTVFFMVFINPASSISSVDIRFGSDSSNYWEKTGITTNYQGESFVNGWNTIGVDWTDLTAVGSPSSSTVDYTRLGVTSTVDVAGVQMAQLWSKMGVLMNISYYSKYLFSSNVGTWKETTTDDSDIINLDTESYNLYLYQVALCAVQQSLGADAGYDTNLFIQQYQDALTRYKKMYKSEVSKPQQAYYSKTFAPYSNYFGRQIGQY